MNRVRIQHGHFPHEQSQTLSQLVVILKHTNVCIIFDAHFRTSLDQNGLDFGHASLSLRPRSGAAPRFPLLVLFAAAASEREPVELDALEAVRRLNDIHRDRKRCNGPAQLVPEIQKTCKFG